MEKIWIACDLYGTYSSLSIEEKADFITYIEDYLKLSNKDNAIFSFVSTASCTDVRFYQQELKQLITLMDSNIEIGPYFGNDGYYLNNYNNEKTMFDSNKGLQLAKVLKNKSAFFKDSDQINEFIYIDDNPNFNILLMNRYLKDTKNIVDKATYILQKEDVKIANDSPFKFNKIVIPDRTFALDGIKKLVYDQYITAELDKKRYL